MKVYYIMSSCLVNQSNKNCYKIKELSKQIVNLQTTINNLENIGISNQFTFRPNYTGPPENSLYTDWNTLYEDLNKMHVSRSIVFDDTDGSIIIPARAEPWNMKNVSWFAPLCVDFGLKVSILYVLINIEDGATLNHLCIVDGLLRVEYKGTTTPAMILDNIQNPPNRSAESLLLRNGALIICSGTQPFIKINTDSFGCIMDFAAQIETGAYEIFDSSTTGFFQIVVGSLCNVKDSTVRGTGTINLVKMDLTAYISQNQPNASLPNYNDNVAAGSMSYVPQNPAHWNGVAPNTVSEALDRIAAFIVSNIGPIP